MLPRNHGSRPAKLVFDPADEVTFLVKVVVEGGVEGRFDDQVDSTAQALGFIGTPDSFDAGMDYMRSEALRGYELTPEDLTVAFDFIYPDIVLDMPSGRSLCREEDGFYHCSRAEWAGLLCMPGVTIIRG